MLLTERWLLQGLFVGFVVSAFMYLVNALYLGLTSWWEKLHPPCSLPVLNLEGWNFNKAKQEYINNLDHYLCLGRTKYRDTGYQLWSPEGYKIILPPKFYEEAGNQNDDVISNTAAKIRVTGGYNTLGVKESDFTETITVVRRHLQGSLASLGNEPSIRMQTLMREEFPKSEEWTELLYFPKLLTVIAKFNTAFIFGHELLQDPKIILAAMTFPMDIVNAGLKIRGLSYPIKFLTVELGLLPQVNKVREWMKYVRQVVPPVLKAREEKARKDSTYEKPNDFIQWLHSATAENEKSRTAVDDLGAQPLFAITAAVHTTGMNLVNVIHHLAWYPEYTAELREEVDKVWEGHGGMINSGNAANLDKLDSYIMEASRHGNFKRINCDRNITSRSGFTFSSGLHLPYGTCFAHDITGQEMDPQLWGDPYLFQPFRFSTMRSEAQAKGERQLWFTSTNPENAMQWGYGKHSCPGRGFATLMLKIFLATLLREWDLCPLEYRQGKQHFPQPVNRGTVSVPATDVKLRFRRRKI